MPGAGYSNIAGTGLLNLIMIKFYLYKFIIIMCVNKCNKYAKTLFFNAEAP